MAKKDVTGQDVTGDVQAGQSATATEAAPQPLVSAILKALTDSALSNDDDSHPDLAGVAQYVADTALTRAPGKPVMRLETLGAGSEGRHMRLAIINDDMPFLVDSVAGAVAAAGIPVSAILHPVVAVRRDGDGRLTEILDKDTSGERRESMIALDLERVDAKGRRDLLVDLEQVLADVRAAVNDWPKLQIAMREDADHCADSEAAALLRWFLDRHFTLLGHEVRDRKGAQSVALGICASESRALLAEGTVAAAIQWFERGGRLPLLIKSNQVSRVHRQVPIDLVILPVHDGSGLAGVSIHAGLWTSAALSASPERVPILRTMLTGFLEKFGFDPAGHAGKALTHVLTALPHDLTVAQDSAHVEELALTAMSIADRPRPKLHLLVSPLGRHLFAFVWLPRDEISTGRRQAIATMLTERSKGRLMSWNISMEEGGAALLRYVIDLRDGGVVPDALALDSELKDMVRGWTPGVEAALTKLGEGRASALASRYAPLFPASFRLTHSAEDAARDILRLHLLDANREIDVRLVPGAQGDVRLKVYGLLGTLPLSRVVPALENFGFTVLEEVPTALEGDRGGHIQNLLLDGVDADVFTRDASRIPVIEDAIADVLRGVAENDAFNQLIIKGAVAPQAVVWLRAMFRYLRQGGTPYDLVTFVRALTGATEITHALVALFTALHDPRTQSETAAKAARSAIAAGLDKVAAIDEDRILRSLHAVIEATLRTNAFAPAAAEALAFKIDSALVPGLPKPLPWREIYVYSPRVEGIHLRAGPVARGGLRWSDRRDDFRTEVLGLMKAQRVKNAVIVPTGAKGGFYPKQLPDPSVNRDAWLAEGTECYRIFIRTLLSITDNLVDGKVVHPDQVVPHDGDDPYFVVAADKGTATFSDVANAIAVERGFWLGDAFASGGSNGYDHKAMGITAKGAWISVQRHFKEMGIDVQSEPVRVVGVGDMSGDVFGNGMLLSKAIKLVAAFDHRHIFIDPNPEPAASWEERNRLFHLPRSSWEDYNAKLISKGGGIFPRSQKSITLSPEAQAALGIDVAEIEPNALMSAILTANADLLWFGGIGTYLKAASQANGDVGDPANDRVRVNAEDLRVRVIGEGANLGVTQAARIVFAGRGGRINTDFIDNSAGVDCSDNEVNIKIALGADVRAGTLAMEDRNVLLASMTDNVSELVLNDNRSQALALSIAERGGAAAVPATLRLIEQFEAEGRLDRVVEGIAGNEELMRRVQDGRGLTRPELAVILSTAKLGIQAASEAAEIGADALMDAEVLAAFPDAMQAAHRQAILTHQLRNEIVGTKIANRLINRMGLTHPFELAEEEGVGMADVAEAFVVAEKLFDLPALWAEIDHAEMSEDARLTLYTEVADEVRAHMADLIRNAVQGRGLAQCVADLSPGVDTLMEKTGDLVQGQSRVAADRFAQKLTASGAPEDVARRVVHLAEADGVVGIVALARETEADPVAVTRAFVNFGQATGLDWAQAVAQQMSPSDPWERLLVAGLARDFQQMRLDTIARLGGEAERSTNEWLDRNADRVTQFRTFVARAQASPSASPAMFAQLAGQARALLSRP